MTFGPRQPEALERSTKPHWVYVLLSAASEPLYVGCSSNPTSRIATWRSSDWWAEVDRFEVQVYPNQREALDAERDLIERHQPRYNTVHTERFNAGGWEKRRLREAGEREIAAGRLMAHCLYHGVDEKYLPNLQPLVPIGRRRSA